MATIVTRLLVTAMLAIIAIEILWSRPHFFPKVTRIRPNTTAQGRPSPIGEAGDGRKPPRFHSDVSV
jgi:hypothetical protein